MALTEIVQRLINLKAEGPYWDFKEMWSENKGDLLHDLICMANNLVNRDAFIIIGVSDSKSRDGVKVKGVNKDNRKNQNDLINFLRDKKFAGGIRPSVYLQTVMIPDDEGVYKEIDVIIIKNSSKTPFFLIEDFKEGRIRAGYIYTRIGDTNTPIDKIADLDKVEYLWRKRFGIDLPVVERLLQLLDSPDDWVGDLNNGDYKYHKFFPEFQIHIKDIEDQFAFSKNCIMKNIARHQINKNFSVSDIVITYHSTVLYREHGIYLDGARILIPFPDTSIVSKDKYDIDAQSLIYNYFTSDSISGKLFNCFACTKNNWYFAKWNNNRNNLRVEPFLVFRDKEDKEQFDEFVKEHLQEIEEEYAEALTKKKYIRNPSTEEYYIGGYSKANEIKAWQLYERYKGISGSSILDKLPPMKKN
ncbi:MAG: ATP-binding protein [Spirochaetia bacterium]|nr:ATP-binding protein [Spirochaetia bacterium]